MFSLSWNGSLRDDITNKGCANAIENFLYVSEKQFKLIPKDNSPLYYVP